MNVWVLAPAVALGALVQALTGFGFSLVLQPVGQLILPGTAGVTLVNALAEICNAFLLAVTRRSVVWRALPRITVGAALGIGLAAVVVREVPTVALQVAVGLYSLLLAARPGFSLTTRAVPSGFISGFSNASVGLGGAPVSAHFRTTALTRQQVVATLQVYFLFLNAASVAAVGVPRVSLGEVAALSVAVVVGLAAGQALRPRISEVRLGVLVRVVVAFGAAVLLTKALL